MTPLELRRVCVFCGSSRGRPSSFASQARALGHTLAAAGLELVYGGGNVGLMGILADAVLEHGGRAIKVIPRSLVEREVAHFGLSELRVVDSMHERKQLMHDLSDAFVALPGGIGTFEELFETLTWSQLGLHAKPCGILDVDGYFRPLVELLDHAVASELLAAEHRDALLVDTDAARLIARLRTHRPPAVEKWLDRDGT
ncbi:MAG: TIGR00730 family Rossman fold protein [bacterium]